MITVVSQSETLSHTPPSSEAADRDIGYAGDPLSSSFGAVSQLAVLLRDKEGSFSKCRAELETTKLGPVCRLNQQRKRLVVLSSGLLL